MANEEETPPLASLVIPQVGGLRQTDDPWEPFQLLDPDASQREAAARPDDLDLWIAEVGEDYVADLVESTRQGVAEGTIPTFGDKESFLQHLTRSALDKPA